MNIYQRAMFESYWLPILLFYFLPCVAMLVITDKSELFQAIIFTLTFPFLILLTGYILAPIFGPKVKENGVYAYIMAYICLGIGATIFSILYIRPAIVVPSIVTIAFIGLFPALIGGTFFLGSCKNKTT